jgi:hypothetical protein
MGHRAGFSFGPRPKGLSGTATDRPPTPLEPEHFPGFSYFLGPPDPESRTTIGHDPKQAREILTALYSLLPLCRLTDNPRIPAGYTFLLQLVAHDLVETTVPFWLAADAGITSRNMRTDALRLDTLYGGGPTACPIAFKPEGSLPDYRSLLRLGLVGDAATLGIGDPTSLALSEGPYALRDIARMKGDPPPPPSNVVGDIAQVYLADERNDDNTLLSQIVVLFSIMHNAIVYRLLRLIPQARFEHASAAVTWIYHRLIRHDLMRKLLHKSVYEILLSRPAGSQDWLWNGDGIPLEFTHGAFRVGHAMVRAVYQFNAGNKFDISQVVGGPVVGDPIRDPLPSSWIVEWSRFFDHLGGTPDYCPKLTLGQQMPLDFPGNLQPVAPQAPDHLMLRDWLSAANARSWRLDKLLEKVKARYGDLGWMDGTGVRAWLQNLVDTSLGTENAKSTVRQNIALLETDLPLPLYILLEAQQDNGGAHLGPLGSIIVGETIFRCLAIEAERLAPQFSAAQGSLGAGDWATITSVDSMPELINLAADWANFTDGP